MCEKKMFRRMVRGGDRGIKTWMNKGVDEKMAYGMDENDGQRDGKSKGCIRGQIAGMVCRDVLEDGL
jgi:hypothetical protein